MWFEYSFLSPHKTVYLTQVNCNSAMAASCLWSTKQKPNTCHIFFLRGNYESKQLQACPNSQLCLCTACCSNVFHWVAIHSVYQLISKDMESSSCLCIWSHYGLHHIWEIWSSVQNSEDQKFACLSCVSGRILATIWHNYFKACSVARLKNANVLANAFSDHMFGLCSVITYV